MEEKYCKNCKYRYIDSDDDPCCLCCWLYEDMWELEGGKNEC